MDFSAELSKIEPDSKEYNFFKRVFEKLEPNCVRKSLKEKQNEVHSKLCDVQEEYFQKSILTDAIMQSAEEFKSQKDDPEALSFVRSTYLNMAKSCLPSEESQKLKPFGLSKDKVSKMLQNRKSQFCSHEERVAAARRLLDSGGHAGPSTSKYAVFKKSIEVNTNDFCKKLVSCLGTVVLPGEDWEKAFERTIKELESKVAIASSKRTKEQLRNKKLQELITTYCQELSRGASLLMKALALIEDRLTFESNFGEMYRLRCHTVSLKLKSCELKILQYTYDRETMPVLKKISTHLQQTEQRLTGNVYEKTATLESYLKLGKRYECLVDEYTALIKSIEQEKWALEELKSKESQNAASGRD